MKTRVQFDFTDASLEHLDDLKTKIGATSRAETVRRAMRLLQFAIDGELYIKTPDGRTVKLELI
jgi:hypothetical protein